MSQMSTKQLIELALERARKLRETRQAELAQVSKPTQLTLELKQEPIGQQPHVVSPAESQISTPAPQVANPQVSHVASLTETLDSIVLNPQQLEAVRLGSKFEDFCLIGAAGTGKTTTQRELVTQLLRSPILPRLASSTKYLSASSPGLVVIAYTRRAVRNIRRRMPLEVQSHCLTFHALLQYKPEEETYFNADGELRNRKVFKPTYTRDNLLPNGLRTVIIEEASMLSTEYFRVLMEALPHGEHTQIICLGDLNQIPPVYGQPILAKKLLSAKVVELTEVYRQALESPILRLAHEVREGKVPAQLNYERQTHVSKDQSSKVTIRTWPANSGADLSEARFHSALRTLTRTGELFGNLTPEGVNPDLPTSVVLCPWNKNFGNTGFNLTVAEGLARKFDQLVYEVICGYRRKYLRVGEQVLVGKLDATITRIDENPKYVGTIPRPATKTLDYHGNDSAISDLSSIDESMEKLAAMLSREDLEDEEVTRQASHVVWYKLNDDEERQEFSVTSAADVMSMDYSYCLSIHKAQGSEWDKVFILLHKCHMRMASRELLYTAITRAKSELEILQPLNGLHLGSRRPRIKGVTLEEKLASLRELLERDAKETLELEN